VDVIGFSAAVIGVPGQAADIENTFPASVRSGQRKRKSIQDEDPFENKRVVKRVQFRNGKFGAHLFWVTLADRTDSPEVISPLHTTTGNTPLPRRDQIGQSKAKSRAFEVFRDPTTGPGEFLPSWDLDPRTDHEHVDAQRAKASPEAPRIVTEPPIFRPKRAFEVYRDPDCR
jgi:hypothetical protein